MNGVQMNLAVAFSEGGSLGQITACPASVVGNFRPLVCPFPL